MVYGVRPAFGSSVGKTFGSPFSGYRGDYMVYPDEPWKLSLRKYPYPTTAQSPLRRSRSASPRPRNADHQDVTKRRALDEIMAKIDSTQEDLHALARKVALWSREAATLSEGLKEQALLLDLSRQADRLAASEAQNRELQKQERVYRLSMENSDLRRELRQLIRICKLLLDRRTMVNDLWVREAADPFERYSPIPPRKAWHAEEGYDTDRHRSRRVQVEISDNASPTAQAAPSHPLSRPARLRPVSATTSSGGSRRQLSYCGSNEEAGIAAGLEGLTDGNAAYVVAADRAQADAEADLNCLSAPRRARGIAAAPGFPDRSTARVHFAGTGHYGKDVAMHAALYKQELDRERRHFKNQVDTAIEEVGGAFKELTLSHKHRSGSGGDACAATPRGDSIRPMPAFGGFVPQEEEVEPTPAMLEAWRRQQRSQQRKDKERRTEVEKVEEELAAAERELAEAVAEEA
ncbi:hypothetical protein VaNZ11_013931, partial [Volvox africanus]